MDTYENGLLNEETPATPMEAEVTPQASPVEQPMEQPQAPTAVQAPQTPAPAAPPQPQAPVIPAYGQMPPAYPTGNYGPVHTQPGYYYPTMNQMPQGYYQPYRPQMPTTPPQPPVPPTPTGTATPATGPRAEASAPEIPVPTEKKETGKTGKRILCAALVVALMAGSCGITAAWINAHWKKQQELLSLSFNDKIRALQEQIDANVNASNGNSVSGTPNVSPEGGLTPAQVYAQNVSSVVAIECSSNYGLSSGSGFVLTADGYIASNYHVVDGATKLTVTFSDGTKYDATFVGGDESNDISLLKIDATDLRPVTIGNSSDLIVGDQVAAIGNPLGELASTLTVGYVSAKDRVITTDGSQINMLQTDAAINPGNSGGPLFNMKGEVIGITTAKYSGTTSSGASIEGIGFAIPMDDVYEMLQDLQEHGYITGAYLGVTVSDVPQTDVDLYGLPLGVLVHDVMADSCAKEAGILPQDIIVDLGGYEITCTNDLTRALRRYKAGDTISVTVYRYSEGGQVILSVTLDAKPQETSSAPTQDDAPSNGTADDWFDHFFG